MDQYVICLEAAQELWVSAGELQAGMNHFFQLIEEIEGEFLNGPGFQLIEKLEKICRSLRSFEHDLQKYAYNLNRMARQHLPAAFGLPNLSQAAPSQEKKRNRQGDGMPDRLQPMLEDMREEYDRFAMIEDRISYALNSLQEVTDLPDDYRSGAEVLRCQLMCLRTAKEMLMVAARRVTYIIEINRQIENKGIL